jgi:hypothetical protein
MILQWGQTGRGGKQAAQGKASELDHPLIEDGDTLSFTNDRSADPKRLPNCNSPNPVSTHPER